MANLQERFNSEFDRIVEQYNLDKKNMAVAVSGGADSLALAFLLEQYTDEKGRARIITLTVNHNLRPEAKDEAKYVAELMKKNGIEHHILEWKHPKLVRGIETRAREARYNLLLEWCCQNKVKILMTAHHLRDQAETFLMRLQRGSGVDGLASMADVIERGNVKIVRPLLNIEPQELRDFLKEKGLAWKEDASNECDDFLRVRVRKFLPKLEKEIGITVQKIGAAVAALAGAREYFSAQADDFINNHCRNWYNCGWSFNPEVFGQLHNEIRFRVMAGLIKNIGDGDYAPEYVALNRLCDSLVDKNFKGATLGGCEILKFNRRIWVIAENKKDALLTKEQWDAYVSKHSEILKHGMPYKLKLNLFGKNVKQLSLKNKNTILSRVD